MRALRAEISRIGPRWQARVLTRDPESENDNVLQRHCVLVASTFESCHHPSPRGGATTTSSEDSLFSTPPWSSRSLHPLSRQDGPHRRSSEPVLHYARHSHALPTPRKQTTYTTFCGSVRSKNILIICAGDAISSLSSILRVATASCSNTGLRPIVMRRPC